MVINDCFYLHVMRVPSLDEDGLDWSCLQYEAGEGKNKG